MIHILSLSLFLISALAQSCSNYGISTGSGGCTCPSGFGGSTCSQPACGGNIFQGTSRSYAPIPQGGGFANLTASGCQCENGWTGTGCNVCQSSSACQSAFSASGAQGANTTGVDGTTGQNDTVVCNTSPKVYAASSMGCNVINPTLQAIYPLSTTLNIQRTLQPSLTPIPNITAFGSSNTVLAQLFYDGVEQFYCSASSCTTQSQSQSGGGGGGEDWTCGHLACTCIPNTSFCGANPVTNLTNAINGLSGTLEISCQAPSSTNSTAQCNFKQSILQQLFGANGLSLSGCTFGECVRQSVIDETTDSTSAGGNNKSSLGGGVIAGLAVVGGLLLLALAFLVLGVIRQRRARKWGVGTVYGDNTGGVSVHWDDIGYTIPSASNRHSLFSKKAKGVDVEEDQTILDSLTGTVRPGEIMAILGPSGAGKTTLVEILAGKAKSGRISGRVSFTGGEGRRVGFVPQQDILPPQLTVREALLFAARLRLPESIPDSQKQMRVEEVMEQLGIDKIAGVRIGGSSGRGRGISGGEGRRVSIGLELVAKPDVLILDEPTSGLDSVSASKIARVLHSLAHNPQSPTAVICSIHQPSSHLYATFDSILLLAHGKAIYNGKGGMTPVEYFKGKELGESGQWKEGYNVADWLLEVASEAPVGLFRMSGRNQGVPGEVEFAEKDGGARDVEANGRYSSNANINDGGQAEARGKGTYAVTFLTQLEVLSGREWKILKRDKTLFWTHVAVACVLGVFCGGLYYQTGITIAGFQSRIGCLFFLGALIAFSSLSALYNVVEIRPLFLRERSSSYYSPTAWLLSRFLFDVIPLRLIPTIIVSTITYWMAGLAPDAAHFFKFLFILVLYTLVMTLFNFMLATLFQNGGIAILLSALTALYQMTYAGFFVHLNSIPPVLRWLQWLCPLKYTLEALSVNEVGSGLMIRDTLQGVPVNISASLIMNLLFGFGSNNYYRDVLVLFAFIAGFGSCVIGVVWLKVRERR